MSTRIQASPETSFIKSAAAGEPKNHDATRIATIALPIIAALAGFVFLSFANAMILAAAVTVCTIVYHTSPSQAKTSSLNPVSSKLPLVCPVALRTTFAQSRDTLDTNSMFAMIDFISAEDANHFDAFIQNRYSAIFNCQTVSDTLMDRKLVCRRPLPNDEMKALEKKLTEELLKTQKPL